MPSFAHKGCEIAGSVGGTTVGVKNASATSPPRVADGHFCGLASQLGVRAGGVAEELARIQVDDRRERCRTGKSSKIDIPYARL
jgi:hypothetical protein